MGVSLDPCCDTFEHETKANSGGGGRRGKASWLVRRETRVLRREARDGADGRIGDWAMGRSSRAYESVGRFRVFPPPCYDGALGCLTSLEKRSLRKL